MFYSQWEIFSVWMDIKSALNGKDRNNILTSCEIGDDAAVKTYTKILEQNEKTSRSINIL